MLGIFCTIVIGTLKVIGGFKEQYEMNEARNHSRDGLTYYDSHGCMRLVSNNMLCDYRTDSSGDTILVAYDKRHHETVKNISEEKRRAEYQRYCEAAMAKGYSAIRQYARYVGTEKDANGKVILGYRYRDVKTGEIYVVRRIGGQFVYVSLTGEIVRPTEFGNENYHERKIPNPNDYIEVKEYKNVMWIRLWSLDHFNSTEPLINKINCEYDSSEKYVQDKDLGLLPNK